MAAPTPAIQAKADQLTEGVTDPREQARRLYAYVAQRIRYVAQQHGIGRVVPQRAGAVLSEGYGDCKDHVALLQALLAAKGIVSDPVLISTKSQFTLPKAPTLSVLDHVILYVPGFDLYLDSTSPYAPFGVLPFADYGKPVIIASAEHPRMARTPDLPPDLATTNVRTQIEIDAEGRISGDTVTTASGPAAISLREIASSIESQGPSSAAEDQLRRLGTPGEGAFAFQTPLELGRSYDLRGSFQLEETLDDAEDGRLSIPAGIPVLVRSGGFLVSPSSNENGDHLCYAGRQSEEIRLTLPPGAHIEQMPRSVRISGGYASYHATYRLTGRTLTVRRQLTVTAPRPVCSEPEYTTMHPVMMAVHRDLRAEIGLTPKDSGPASTPSSAAVAQGGVPGAAPQLGTPARLNRPGL